MLLLKTYDLFISHAWTLDTDYYRLEKLLKDATNFAWCNHSVPRPDRLDTASDAQLRNALRNQIKPVNAALVISSMYAAYRDWIEVEIAIANVYEKPIIGIKPWGQERIPEIVRENAVDMVGWEINSIISSIRAYSI